MQYIYHRDIMGRIIRVNDFCIWSNGKRNQSLDIVKVVYFTNEKVRCINLKTGVKGNKYPSNLMVVTQQLSDNMLNNVGANRDLEENRDNIKD